MQLLILTRIHYGLPLAAPLAELLGVLFFYLCSLHEAGHNVIARLKGLFSSVHCTHIIPWLGGRKIMMCKNNRGVVSSQTHRCTVSHEVAIPRVVVLLDLIINIILTIQKLCFLASSGGSFGRLAIIGNVSV